MTAEHGRLREANDRGVPWRKWGPYLRDSARPGGRELPGNPDATAVQGQLRSWAYQCSEDGPAGICDDQMRLCFAIAIRGGNDGTLQERLRAMPLTYSRRCAQADNLPTHSYLRAHHRYRQPGMLATSREAASFDVIVEYAKRGPEEILIQIEVKNTGCETATLQVLPQLWIRPDASVVDPNVVMARALGGVDVPCLVARHPELGAYYLHCELAGAFLFSGPRAAAHYMLILAPRAVQRIRMLLTGTTVSIAKPALDKLFTSLKQHREDANEFFAVVTYACDDAASAADARRAFCNMLWNKTVWMSAVTGWLYDRRPGAGSSVEAREPATFRLKLAQVVAPPRKRACPLPESPAWLLHTLALACIDADFAAHQLRLLLKCELHNRVGPVGGVPHEWQALKPWAALLMYQLQRPRRPRDATNDLADNFDALQSQSAGGGWAAIRAQCMLDISLELATRDARYEQRAIECYVSFVAAVAALDCEATLLDTHDEDSDDDPGFRIVISEKMQFQVLSSMGLMALSGAVAFPAGALAGLPRFRERLRAIHREHASRICRQQHLHTVLHRLFGVPNPSGWTSLAAAMLSIRALSRIEALHGTTIRVRSSAHGGSMLGPAELVRWLIHEHVAAAVAPADRVRLLDFCDYVYSRNAANAGQRTGWAGRVAAMICASWNYSPFDREGLESPAVIEHAGTGASNPGVPGLKLIQR